MKDIRLSLGFLDHPKTIRLKRLLGWDGIESLIRLWFFAAQYKPDGCLEGMVLEDIEIAAKWSGDFGLFVNTIDNLNWLEKKNGCYWLHDWEQHNGWVAHSNQRTERAKRGAAAKWDNYYKNKEQLKQDDILQAGSKQKISTCLSSAPSPSPSPSPKPKDKNIDTSVSIVNGTVDEKESKSPDNCPHEKIIDLYHEILPGHSRVDKDDWGPNRQKTLKARWRENKKRQSLDWWHDFFERVSDCPWLMGENDSGWKPNLDWLLTLSNFIKVNEGYYQSRASPQAEFRAKYGDRAINTARKTKDWKPPGVSD